jgi:hypothetical protein
VYWRQLLETSACDRERSTCSHTGCPTSAVRARTNESTSIHLAASRATNFRPVVPMMQTLETVTCASRIIDPNGVRTVRCRPLGPWPDEPSWNDSGGEDLISGGMILSDEAPLEDRNRHFTPGGRYRGRQVGRYQPPIMRRHSESSAALRVFVCRRLQLSARTQTKRTFSCRHRSDSGGGALQGYSSNSGDTSGQARGRRRQLRR